MDSLAASGMVQLSHDVCKHRLVDEDLCEIREQIPVDG